MKGLNIHRQTTTEYFNSRAKFLTADIDIERGVGHIIIWNGYRISVIIDIKGSVSEMCDEIQRHRENYGVDSIVVSQEPADIYDNRQEIIDEGDIGYDKDRFKDMLSHLYHSTVNDIKKEKIYISHDIAKYRIKELKKQLEAFDECVDEDAILSYYVNYNKIKNRPTLANAIIIRELFEL